jgi:hypothetical protein
MNIIKSFFALFVSKRFKSFYWRFGMMFAAGALDLLVESTSTLNVPPQVVIVVGLVFGEISKWIKNKMDERKLQEASALPQ